MDGQGWLVAVEMEDSVPWLDLLGESGIGNTVELMGQELVGTLEPGQRVQVNAKPIEVSTHTDGGEVRLYGWLQGRWGKVVRVTDPNRPLVPLSPTEIQGCLEALLTAESRLAGFNGGTHLVDFNDPGHVTVFLAPNGSPTDQWARFKLVYVNSGQDTDDLPIVEM